MFELPMVRLSLCTEGEHVRSNTVNAPAVTCERQPTPPERG